MIRNKLIPLIGILVVIILWIVIPALGVVDNTLFPIFLDVVKRLFDLFASNQVFSNVWGTIYRTLLGFIISSIIAIPIGLFIGSQKFWQKALNPIIDFFRFLPGTAMFPLFLLLFGIGDGSKIAISIFISFWIILINTIYGVIYSSQLRRLAAKSLGASPWRVFRDVTVMDALPYIMVGLKNGLSLSLIAVVVSEMFIGSSLGLGQMIYNSYLTYESSDLYAWLIITGILGFIINKIFVISDKKLLHWAGK
jgi:NitT/TauT family transport system permease protein